MVATFTELRSSATAVSYYEKDGYYAKNDPEHRQASFWFGAGAATTGLRAHVHPTRFEEVLRGEVPGTDIRLGRLREGEIEHRPGWDLTFSAPKSVSLEALVLGDRRVIRAHDDAVRATLTWVEAELLETRGWDPATRRRPRVKAHGMVAGGFRHLTSRNLDPQLHTHCVIANMTRDASGKWKSVEPTRMRREMKLIGAFYRNELARRLQALGMAVTPTLIGDMPGFELAGYSRSFLDAFSGRRREILAYLKLHNLPYTAQLAQTAALHTRRAKRDVALAELVPDWRMRAALLGLKRHGKELKPDLPCDPLTGERASRPVVEPPETDEKALRTLRRTPALPRLPRGRIAERAAASPRMSPDRSTVPATLLADPELGVLEAVARAVTHVGERRTTISQAAIRAMALGHAPGRYTLADIDAAIERLVREGELVETVRKGMDRAFVTARALLSERKVLAAMRSGRGKGPQLADREAVDRHLGAGRLTDGQKEAVRTLLLSSDWLVGVQGHAGSGKTTMLRTARELLGTTRILGLAPSASAARVLEREAGIEARTLQYFLVRYGALDDPERLRQAREAFAGAVLAVDEASMIDTSRMEALVRIARQLGVARVTLVGDTAQLRAVDAGQPFRLLQRAGMTVARMPQVLRQRDPELLDAVGHARSGAPAAAIGGLGPQRVREVAREELGREAAKAWLSMSRRERDDALILVPTHAVRLQANQAVREGLEDEGVLHGRTLVIDRLVSRRLTRALAADIASYEPGDTVVFNRTVYGRNAGDICMVMRIEAGEVVVADAAGRESRFRPSGNVSSNLQLHDTERIEVREGERIRWTRNRASPGRRFNRQAPPDLVNGEEAQVLEIGTATGRVRFRNDEGREFTLARTDPQLRHLDHAYATTVHAAQGKTARTAIAVLDAAGATDQALFHVEVSRASEAFLLLTDDREALMEMLEQRPVKDESALEALGLDPSLPPAIPPELFAELSFDWRTLKRESRETGTAVFLLPGYRDVMARAAALAAVEDLPADMRRLAESMLAEHAVHHTRTRQLRRLVDGLWRHARRWPEIDWASRSGRFNLVKDVPGYDAWRSEGAALAEQARDILETDNDLTPHLDAMRAGRARLARARAVLEHACLTDDARRFAGAWSGLRERACETGIPEVHVERYAEVAALGERLAQAEGLDARHKALVTQWRDVHDEQTRLAEAVRALPGDVVAWRARRASDLPLDANGGADPALSARHTWRTKGLKLAGRAETMLERGSAHEAHLTALPGARDAVAAASGKLREALALDERGAFAWLVRETMASGAEPFHHPRYGEMIARAHALARDPGLPHDLRALVHSWIDYHRESADLVEAIRAWPGQARAMLADCPAMDAGPEKLAAWDKRAAALLARARAMRDDDSVHALHLAAMPDGREAIDAAARQLAGQIQRNEPAIAEALRERQARIDEENWRRMVEHEQRHRHRRGLSM